MSRNEIHNFGQNPQVHIERSKFPMHNNIKFTGNTGDLIPFYLAEVLPGDTFEVKTSFVARLQTLIHPLMDNMFLDTYYFYVPNRLVWDNWQHFCGEPDKAWVPTTEYTVPQIEINPKNSLWYYADEPEPGEDPPDPSFHWNDFASKFKDSILDYLGVGLSEGMEDLIDNDESVVVNALPVRAVSKVYDDWFRDENLIDPLNIYTGDLDTYFDPTDPLTGGVCFKAAKLHDYFTSCLPDAQRGDPVTLSANFNGAKAVPVGTVNGQSHAPTLAGNWTPIQLQSAGNSKYFMNIDTVSDKNIYGRQNWSSLTSNAGLAPSNLYAQLIGNNVNLGITINDLRLAFQVQKFMEKSARGGARYIELLNVMFGVTSPDSRLQRSEYLGGHRVPLTIHQIVNQSETQDTPLGNTGAMSVTSDTHQDFIHSFVEHGFVIGFCVVRYKHSYSQGFNKLWSRKTKFNYYWPVFAHIGEQPVLNNQIYFDGSYSQVFGYQEAWAEYRYMPDRVAGEMRPGIPNTLASWHLGDYYTEAPTLSEGWIGEDLAPVDRAIAVTSQVADQLLFDVYVQNVATRPMPVYSIPGLVDHY